MLKHNISRLFWVRQSWVALKGTTSSTVIWSNISSMASIWVDVIIQCF